MLIHTVKRGDTLWQIAQQHQITLDALLAANPQLSDPNYILPGSQLNIPQLTVLEDEETVIEQPPLPGDAEGLCHNDYERPCIFLTTGGENLYSIAEDWDVPLAQLHYHNYQYPKNLTLPAGERIIIPAAYNYRVNNGNYGTPPQRRRRR